MPILNCLWQTYTQLYRIKNKISMSLYPYLSCFNLLGNFWGAFMVCGQMPSICPVFLAFLHKDGHEVPFSLIWVCDLSWHVPRALRLPPVFRGPYVLRLSCVLRVSSVLRVPSFPSIPRDRSPHSVNFKKASIL